jgi:hypothetical protein
MAQRRRYHSPQHKEQTMETERNRILAMVEAGTISAAEADELLQALGPGPAGEAATQTLPLKRDWEIPFGAGLVMTFLGLVGLLQRKRGFLASVGAWSTFLLGVLVAAAGLGGRNSPWLHVRVQEPQGNNVHLSFPVPLFLAHWLLGLARPYVDAQTGSYLDGASDFLRALSAGDASEPFSVEIEGDNGEQVLIYLG